MKYYWDEKINCQNILNYQKTYSEEILNTLIPEFKLLIIGVNKGNSFLKKFLFSYLEDLDIENESLYQIIKVLKQSKYNKNKGTTFSYFSLIIRNTVFNLLSKDKKNRNIIPIDIAENNINYSYEIKEIKEFSIDNIIINIVNDVEENAYFRELAEPLLKYLKKYQIITTQLHFFNYVEENYKLNTKGMRRSFFIFLKEVFKKYMEEI